MAKVRAFSDRENNWRNKTHSFLMLFRGDGETFVIYFSLSHCRALRWLRRQLVYSFQRPHFRARRRDTAALGSRAGFVEQIIRLPICPDRYHARIVSGE